MTMAVLGQSQPLMYGQQIMQMPDGSFTQTVAYGTVAAADASNAAAAASAAVVVDAPSSITPTTATPSTSLPLPAPLEDDASQQQQQLQPPPPPQQTQQQIGAVADLSASAVVEDSSTADDQTSLSDGGLTSPSKGLSGGVGGSTQITVNNRYRCSECARGLSTGFSLKRHMHTVHGMAKVCVFMCVCLCSCVHWSVKGRCFESYESRCIGSARPDVWETRVYIGGGHGCALVAPRRQRTEKREQSQTDGRALGRLS